MGENNPLIEALPPATDYLTYLTIIEYNLTLDNLPTLHQVLQDAKLTTNIGWDLVHLLVPLLPASEQCLQDIARLGNPREVILKVTESLRLIDFDGLSPTDDDEPVEAGASSGTQHHPVKTAAVDVAAPAVTQAVELPPPSPLPVNQFTCLLSMLSILHPRIKTQYPSRFLATTLQAVLASLSQSVSHREELISAIVRFVNTISGTKRPHLPPRKSSATLTSLLARERAPDPEPDTEADEPSLDESAIQARLLQSFLTHVLEDYMLGLSSDEDVPGVAWCVRLQETLHPERTIPGKTSMTQRFSSGRPLNARLTAVGDILALTRDLKISSEELLAAATSVEQQTGSIVANEDEPPKTAADIPFSKNGSLLLFTARSVVKPLYSSTQTDDLIDIFPTHQKLLTAFTSEPASTGATLGSEPEAVLDAILALALLSVENNMVGTPSDNDQFNGYLQLLSLISSNCPSPSLRYNAYYLTTTILRSNPSDVERLAFIRDTLEHCPFDNLRVAAVSWIKGEIIEANPPSSSNQKTERDTSSSVFATPVALDTLAPFLFPDLTHDLTNANLMESWVIFEQGLPFYLTSLNFYYLLLCATHLHDKLDIPDLHSNNDIAGSFLGPLNAASEKFQTTAKEGGELFQAWQADSSVEAHLAELALLHATTEKVTRAVAGLNKARQ